MVPNASIVFFGPKRGAAAPWPSGAVGPGDQRFGDNSYIVPEPLIASLVTTL